MHSSGSAPAFCAALTSAPRTAVRPPLPEASRALRFFLRIGLGTPAFGSWLPANAAEGQKRFPISRQILPRQLMDNQRALAKLFHYRLSTPTLNESMGKLLPKLSSPI